MSQKFRPAMLAVLLGALAGLAGAQTGAAPRASPPPPAAATAAATSAPADAPAVRVLLTPETETVLLAQMPGAIVTLNGALGSPVRKGQLLVAFDCSEHAARLAMAQAELASARETHDSKVRLKGLEAAGDIEVALARATVAKAEGQIQMTQAQIRNCSVHAPFSGRIAKLHVKPFQGVTAGQPLLELVSEGAPRLRLNVPSRWLRGLRVGTPFEVAVDETGKTYRGSVSAVNSRVDAVAQTIEVEGRITGRHAELLPGMSGSARFAPMP